MNPDGSLDIEPIAHMRIADVAGQRGTIVFESRYRDPDALRGIDTFSHLWIIWGSPDEEIELSVVVLDEVEKTKGKGHVLNVSQVDMPDRAPIFDIKPYLPFVDAHLSLE